MRTARGARKHLQQRVRRTFYSSVDFVNSFFIAWSPQRQGRFESWQFYRITDPKTDTLH